MSVKPGAQAEITDRLPADLAQNPPHALAYRVRLLNASGHSAGAAGPVFAASGAAPPAVASLVARPTKAGVLLEWHAQPQPGTVVQLERATAQPARPEKAAGTGINSLLVSPREATQSRMKAGDADAGGTLDRSAEIGQTYSYTAWRVRTVSLGGQTLEIRSAVSAPMTVAVKNVFPPDVPTGLVAAPGFAGEGSAAKPTIDLSWEPDMEPHLAGYRVYRRELDGAQPSMWKLMTPQLVASAAFSDPNVEAEKRYAYRVTAVSDAGAESAPTAEVQETAQAPE